MYSLLLGKGLYRVNFKYNPKSYFLLSANVQYLRKTEASIITKSSFSEILQTFTLKQYGGTKFAGSYG